MAPIFIFLLLPASPANPDATASAAFAMPKAYFRFEPAAAALEWKTRLDTQKESQKKIDDAFDAERIYSETWAARFFPPDFRIAAQPNGAGPFQNPKSFHYDDLDPWLNLPRPDLRGGALINAKEKEGPKFNVEMTSHDASILDYNDLLPQSSPLMPISLIAAIAPERYEEAGFMSGLRDDFVGGDELRRARNEFEKRVYSAFDADRIYAATWAARPFHGGPQIKFETWNAHGPFSEYDFHDFYIW